MTSPQASLPIPRISLLGMARHALFSPGDERTDMLSALTRVRNEHGDVAMQDLGFFKMINLFGPEANRLVLTDRDRIFSARKPWMQIMGKIFPNGLLLQDGAVHKHHRRIMHVPFKRPALRIYGDHMNAMIEERLDRFAKEPSPLLAYRAYKELTLDMAAKIFLGIELGSDNASMNAAFENMVAASMSRIRLPLPGLEFNRGLNGRTYMLELLSDLIPKRRASDGSDMLTRLCHAETEDGQRFSDAEISDHMIFLMMAAHDTTTSTLCSLTYELAKNPQWQERLREESLAQGSGAISFDEVPALEGFGLVMKETLRRYPPLPVIPRVATASFEFKGFRIPKNAMVVISPIHTHHMPEWWDDPHRFDPSRFGPGRLEQERHTHAWVPFGGGPHMCLGFRFAELQVAALVHQLLQRFRITVPEGYEMPVQQAPISKPRDGLPITLEPLR